MTRAKPGHTPFPAAASEPAHYILRLYVTGTTASSLRAIRNLRDICETCLDEHYDIEVIDIYQHPEATRDDQVIAAPTLVKLSPLPRRMIIGDLSDRDRVLRALDVRAAGT